MRTWLLTWSPGPPVGWTTEKQDRQQVRSGHVVRGSWSIHNTKSIVAGDRLFFFRQKVSPKGIFASAVATGIPYEADAWTGERGKKTNYVPLAFDAILDSENEPILELDELMRGPLASVNWNTKRSGIEIEQKAALLLEKVWLKHLDSQKRGVLPVPLEMPSEDSYLVEALEGESSKGFVTHRKRERLLRTSKIRNVLARTGRLACEVPNCGFDFLAIYGELGDGFAHVHHLNPISDRAKPELTRLDDLAIVCANCHAMIHKGGECRELEEVSPQRTRARDRRTTK